VFAAIAEIVAGPERAAEMAADHERYSRVAEAHPGLLFKHVMRCSDDERRFVDVMTCESQADSEAFGIDPVFQRIRPSRGGPYQPVVPERSWMNPGYYRNQDAVVRDCEAITRQVVGYFHAAHGREQEFAARSARFAAELAAGTQPIGFWSFVNLGLPEWWCLVLQRDDAAAGLLPGDFTELCSVAPTLDVGDLVMRFDRPQARS